MANLLKNPLLNPALLSINPSLYAVQLAQLQAAQLLSQGSALSDHLGSSFNKKSAEEEALALAAVNMRKRKLMEESDRERVLNLSKRSPLSSPRIRSDSPLDLSGNQRPMGLADFGSPAKVPKMDMPAWAGAFPFLNPFLAAGGQIPGVSLPSALGMPTMTSTMTTSAPSPSIQAGEPTSRNPLDRMTEIAKGSQANIRTSLSNSQRQSAWQSQWISRGPESNKDIFKCVWCKESYPTLQGLTAHMKETKHFGSSIPPAGPSSPLGGRPSPHVPAQSSPVARPPQATPPIPSSVPSSVSSPSQGPSSQGPAKSRDILKEQLPLPRKLVRGQDVWLGRGEQQTRDILKCMWCGESFRSLDLMTRHMQETKHYTKVISQEQLVSWKSSDAQSPTQSAVNTVLTCKVCEQPFSSLKELSDHMVKSNHYNDQQQSPPAQPSPHASPRPAAGEAGRGRSNSAASSAGSVGGSAGPPVSLPLPPAASTQATAGGGAKEKRKKSLPVRKLLELERAQQELSGNFKPSVDEAAGKISCEKCGDKILMHLFVDHIRQCVGPMPIARPLESSSRHTPSASPPAPSHTPGSDSKASPGGNRPGSSKSILGSLEMMVQSNFGAKKKTGADGNLSILQRLGIDEGVDYGKPLVDPMAMFKPPASTSPLTMASMTAAAAAAQGLFPSLMRASGAAFEIGVPKTPRSGSNSGCSSPDRLKAPSVKSEGSVRSPKVEIEVDDSEDERKEHSTKDPKSPAPSLPESNGGEIKIEDDKEPVKAESPSSNPSPASSPSKGSPRQTSTPGKEDIEVDDDDKADETAKEGEEAEEKDKQEEEEEEEKEINEPPKKKGKKENPLAALQMLCDKTEKTPKQPPATSASVYGVPTDPGAIMAFSWACNQAVVNDSLLKCPFCDTPFISKGAYRHHLSKMHFVKDGAANPALMMAAAGRAAAANAAAAQGTAQGEGAGEGANNGEESKEENAQSKFQKYSQLAKQLSCSSQP